MISDGGSKQGEAQHWRISQPLWQPHPPPDAGCQNIPPLLPAPTLDTLYSSMSGLVKLMLLGISEGEWGILRGQHATMQDWMPFWGRCMERAFDAGVRKKLSHWEMGGRDRVRVSFVFRRKISGKNRLEMDGSCMSFLPQLGLHTAGKGG